MASSLTNVVALPVWVHMVSMPAWLHVFPMLAWVHVVSMPVWMHAISTPAWVHVADVQLMLASTMTHLAAHIHTVSTPVIMLTTLQLLTAGLV